MASLNKVMIIGNLGRDPEVSYTPSGLAICKFSIATTDVRVDRNSGERTERTEWHRITVFGKTAENCGRFLAKGRQVYVEGRLQTSSYEKDGITRYSTDIIANQVTFLGGRNAEGGGGGQQGGGFGGGGQNNNYQGGGYNQNQNQSQGGGYGSAGGYPGSYNSTPQQPAQQQPPQQPAAQPQSNGFDQGGSFGGGDPGFTNPPDDDIPF
ncbi:single-stranded DNA-binding protein [Desulfoluna spongiiphila]|uniref:Single-stranded DNA-binding protein n=1 Tax=Desulfoluna spongiiphila TaxID=419481 RepID=A0A1G5I4D1_9BACT|nr:single-stranded DNA-binding protein [Desulfoluna spongiiphila]SCY70218.1 single-strand binding protein [Desulfoluna spongiiphila]